jgi:hypothetical protein
VVQRNCDFEQQVTDPTASVSSPAASLQSSGEFATEYISTISPSVRSVSEDPSTSSEWSMFSSPNLGARHCIAGSMSPGVFNPRDKQPEPVTLLEYPCGSCKETFPKRYSRNKHVNTKHNRRYQCLFCDQLFAVKRDKERHENTKHERKFQYWCTVDGCTRTSAFSREDNLKRHISAVHKTLAVRSGRHNSPTAR